MITLTHVYWFAGLCFAIYAVLTLRDVAQKRRWSSAAFWGLLALSMLAGDYLGDVGNGLLVVALVAIAGFGGLTRGEKSADDAAAETAFRQGEAARNGNRLFLLALVIPATALIGTFLFKRIPHLVDPGQVTLIALAAGVLAALAIGYAWLRPPPLVPLQQGRRLMDAVGWAAVLPQMLASLGAVFALAGVGNAVGSLLSMVIPDGSLVGAVIAYGVGMALFTMAMGNAFAAFPVMLSAVALPILIHQHHGNPAIVAAIGMLAGFCGTLMTPMAANFNIVPAALLELDNRNGVVRAQIGTALPLLAVNIALIYWLAFP